MDKNTVKSRLTTVFRDVFDDDGIELSDSTTADDIEAWDSLEHITLKGILSAKGDGSPYFCPYPESLKETGIPSFYVSPVFGGNIFPVKMPDGTEKYLSSMMIFLDDTAESYRKDAPAEAEITFKSLAYDTGSVNSWVRVHVTPETISVSE